MMKVFNSASFLIRIGGQNRKAPINYFLFLVIRNILLTIFIKKEIYKTVYLLKCHLDVLSLDSKTLAPFGKITLHTTQY